MSKATDKILYLRHNARRCVISSRTETHIKQPQLHFDQSVVTTFVSPLYLMLCHFRILYTLLLMLKNILFTEMRKLMVIVRSH